MSERREYYCDLCGRKLNPQCLRRRTPQEQADFARDKDVCRSCEQKPRGIASMINPVANRA